jgi:hypothetical protein
MFDTVPFVRTTQKHQAFDVILITSSFQAFFKLVGNWFIDIACGASANFIN